jgi:hypothetical protein
MSPPNVYRRFHVQVASRRRRREEHAAMTDYVLIHIPIPLISQAANKF